MNIAKFLRTPILKNIYERTASINSRSAIFQTNWKAEDFIFHVLQRNFPNVCVKILCEKSQRSAKSVRSFLLFFKLFSTDIHLFKIWLKRSQNECIFSFSILKCHRIVQTNRKNELSFKGEHSYK